MKKSSKQSESSTLTAKYDVNGDNSPSATSSTSNSTSTKESKSKYGTLTAAQDANNDYE